jgi:hypothetical protein
LYWLDHRVVPLPSNAFAAVMSADSSELDRATLFRARLTCAGVSAASALTVA